MQETPEQQIKRLMGKQTIKPKIIRKQVVTQTNENEVWEKILTVITATLTVVVVGLLLGFPLMWLWNWLMPMIFGLTTINFWQAVGINILSSLLFSK